MTALEALEDCLAAEHAALYAYGVLGGVLSAAERRADETYAVSCYTAHRARRDELVTMIARRDDVARPAEPVYATPFPVSDVAQCRRLARLVERRTAARYGYAVAETVGATRRMVAVALTDASIRAVHWGDDPPAFPGAPDL